MIEALSLHLEHILRERHSPVQCVGLQRFVPRLIWQFLLSVNIITSSRDTIHCNKVEMKCSVNIENVLKISRGTNKT